jgi:hypothetical protein
MFRTNASQGSPCVYAVLRPDLEGGLPDPAWQWRLEQGANAAHDQEFFDTNMDVSLPYWLRLTYEDGLVTGSYAPDIDGEPHDWISPLEPQPLPVDGDSFLAGICVTSHQDTLAITASFSGVFLEGVESGTDIHVRLGDTNGDGQVNIADAITLLGYLFGGGARPGCVKGADVNDDDQLNIADAISTLGYLFGGGGLTAPDGTPVAAGAALLCVPYPEETVTTIEHGCEVPCTP